MAQRDSARLRMGPSKTGVGSASLASTTRTVSSTATSTCVVYEGLEGFMGGPALQECGNSSNALVPQDAPCTTHKAPHRGQPNKHPRAAPPAHLEGPRGGDRGRDHRHAVHARARGVAAGRGEALQAGLTHVWHAPARGRGAQAGMNMLNAGRDSRPRQLTITAACASHAAQNKQRRTRAGRRA